MPCWQFALALAACAAPAPGFPKFETQEIDAGLKIGYAVILADLDGDEKPDIVVVDQHKVVWYQNPTWKKRVILDGKTKPDNVCIAAGHIDDDGDLDLVVGAGWKPMDTKNPGTLQWLKRGKSLDDEWTMYPIPCDEPTVHRVRIADLNGDGKPEVVMAPLMGREATKEKNWMDGRPVRIVAYKVPWDPTKPAGWKAETVCDELHVVHNIDIHFVAKAGFGVRTGISSQARDFPAFSAVITAASYEGVTEIRPAHVGRLTPAGAGNQATPAGSRGSSEITVVNEQGKYVGPATVEPWHGNQIVVYAGRRVVLDDKLRWGHAVKWMGETLVAGVRDDPNAKLGDPFTDRRGVRLYRTADGWKTNERMMLDPGGVAVEDLAVGDLDGDGKPDIVAVGRATGNCRIYWNKGN